MSHDHANSSIQAALRGVSAVLIAPFHDRIGSINAGVLARLVSRAEGAGIHVVTALGNTGEAFQLTCAERQQILATVASARSSSRLLAGLAGPFDDILRQADRVGALGYDGVLLHEPVDPFASSHGLERFYIDLADRLPLPVVLYLRSPRLGADAALRCVGHPNVVGIKYARTDLNELTALVGSPEALTATWVCGAAESFVPAFSALGIVGFTSGLANVRPDLSMEIWHASAERDWDSLLERVKQILPFELMRTREGGRHNVSVVKRALTWQGWSVGDVRPPCVDLDAGDERSLRDVLTSWPAEQTVSA